MSRCVVEYNKRKFKHTFVFGQGWYSIMEVGLKDFYSMVSSGYIFMYDLEYQSQTRKLRCSYVNDDIRVFDRILIAFDPSCIKFSGSNGSSLQLDFVRRIVIQNRDSERESIQFDVVCEASGVEEESFSFFARKKC